MVFVYATFREIVGTALLCEPYYAADEFAKRLNPQPASTQFDTLVGGLEHVNWKIPMVYVICHEALALLPEHQEIMISKC